MPADMKLTALSNQQTNVSLCCIVFREYRSTGGKEEWVQEQEEWQ